MSKSRIELMREMIGRYELQHGKEWKQSDIVEWALSTGEYSLSQEAIAKRCWSEIKSAIKADVDDDGDPNYLNAEIAGAVTYCRRETASWRLRNDHVRKLASQISADMKSAERLVAKLNAERKDGEPEFQLRIDWDQQATG